MLRDKMLSDFERADLRINAQDAYAFSNWSGYLDKSDPQTAWAKAEAAGARTLHLHTSGHASPADLSRFARAMAPKALIPVHGVAWDDADIELPTVKRLSDGERWTIA